MIPVKPCHTGSLTQLFDAMKRTCGEIHLPNSLTKNAKHRTVFSFKSPSLNPTLTGPTTKSQNTHPSFETTDLRLPSSSDVLQSKPRSISTASRNRMDLEVASPGLEAPHSDSIKPVYTACAPGDTTGGTTPLQVDMDMDTPTEPDSLDTLLIDHHKDKPHGMPLTSDNRHLCKLLQQANQRYH